MNACSVEIRFICSTHTQPKCQFFEKDINVPSTSCKFGMPDRKCRNNKANQKALVKYSIKMMMRVKNAKKT